ncbi:MAG: hypothetical protein J6T06_05755 [Victivallales bacterium]|nr:hypothetical protein [Victivallales bacterium]
MDKYRDCQLKDVRLEGVPGEKMDRFLQFRVLSDFAKKDIFGEARSLSNGAMTTKACLRAACGAANSGAN